MLSLRLRSSVCKTLPPQKFFQFFSHQKTSDDQTHGFPPLPATKTNSGLKEEEKGGIEQAMQLPEGLRRESMPRHVAVIMDGNSRWARQRGMLTPSGHEAGVRSLKEFIRLCLQWGIKVVTVFAFSMDNWTRPKEEVDIVMTMIENLLKSGLDDFIREGTRVSIIGDTSRVPKSLQRTICDIEEMTRENSKFHFIMAISYSGTYDVVQACKSVAQKVKDGVIQVEDINESAVQQELETKCCEFPCPDLLIRTSGELRISNFLLWQSAYSELFFAKALWPDFGKADFVEALTSYQHRQRRYGGRYS
jgi:ditrans,polycis-polyprenyl diphosphate synthase